MLEYIQVIFHLDDTAEILIKRDNETIRKTCLHAGKTLVWMVKTGNKWEWHKDLDTGEEIAVFEK
jgi:hypothetical protein